MKPEYRLRFEQIAPELGGIVRRASRREDDQSNRVLFKIAARFLCPAPFRIQRTLNCGRLLPDLFPHG